MIRFENVSKHYGSVKALNGINLEIPAGRFVVLIGPSGCGKTTALKMVNRLITPTSGRIFVGDEDVARLNAVELRRNIGYVIQETGLFPHMTIADNIALVPRLKKWPRARRDERVDELLHLVGLDPAVYRNRFPRHLSGGQRQRVGVARALASDPPIILMDEPFGATDPITRKQLQRELKRIERQVQKTIVFVTHDIAEAFLLADSICLLRKGEIVQYASPEELLRQPADEFVAEFLGDEAVLRQFEFLRMGEIASSAPAIVRATATVAAARAHLAAEPHDLFAVVDDSDRLVGMLSPEQLWNGSPSETRVGDLALANPLVARTHELVSECFARLSEHQFSPGHHTQACAQNGHHTGNGHAHALVVVDEAGHPLGLVRYSDLVQLVAGLATGDGLRPAQAPTAAQATGRLHTASGRSATQARAHAANGLTPRPDRAKAEARAQ